MSRRVVTKDHVRGWPSGSTADNVIVSVAAGLHGVVVETAIGGWSAGVDENGGEAGGGESVGVAEDVGDGLDAGEPGVGCVVEPGCRSDGTVPWAGVATLTTLNASPSGSKSLPVVEHVDRRVAVVRAVSGTATGGWLGSPVARMRMMRSALGDVAVGVGDEVVECVVGVDQ